MSTPTDPYNSASKRPFDDDDVLEPIADTTPDNEPALDSSESATAPNYGASDQEAWDTAFSLSDPSFEPEEAKDEAETQGDASLTLEGDNPSFADNTAQEDSLSAPSSELSADKDPLPAYTVPEREPLVEGETFASAYQATGTTQAASESAVPQTPQGEENEGGFHRESVLPGGVPGFADPTADGWKTERPTAMALVDLPEEPKKRVGAHIGSIFATLVLIPIVWYLISDAGVRLNLVQDNPWLTGKVNVLMLVEFLAGFVAMWLLWLMARSSTLGAQIWGFVLTVAGLAALVVPQHGVKVIEWIDRLIGDYNAFTGNVVHHLNLDLGSGRIALFGFALFLTGFMIHSARKSAARRADALARRDVLLNNR